MLAGAAALLASAVVPGAAQQITQPVEIIVPFTAGGSTDLSARVLAAALQDEWDVPVRVVNIPGGNTVPAVDELMNSDPDGHRVMLDIMSSSSLLQLVVPDLPYAVTDRTFVTLAAQTPMLFAVANDSPFQTIEDVAEAAKENPDGITWTSLGGTGVIDMAFHLFFRELGIDVNETRPVVLRGGSEAAVQTAGGHVMLGSGSYGSYSSLLPAGEVRVLAVFAPERSRILPDVPTMAEEGYPNSNAVQWMGISGPPNMPDEVIEAWNTAMTAVLDKQEVIDGLANIGIEPMVGTGAQMREIVEQEINLLEDLFAN